MKFTIAWIPIDLTAMRPQRYKVKCDLTLMQWHLRIICLFERSDMLDSDSTNDMSLHDNLFVWKLANEDIVQETWLKTDATIYYFVQYNKWQRM